MKTNILTVTLLSVSLLELPLTDCFGQGVLTPPHPPAPTMKTLDQIEPRIAISSAPYVITQQASYYLTTNITVSSGNAITIHADNVTLDLNGFTISSTETPAASSSAILLVGGTNVVIFNGVIRSGVANNGGIYGGSGFGNGIAYSGLAPLNVRISHVSIWGCQLSGIFLGADTVVESCKVYTTGGVGIQAGSVFDSVARDCGDTGISAIMANNCVGSGGAGGAGNGGVHAATANNCYGSGFHNASGVTAATANNCFGIAYGSGTGVDASIANNCYGDASFGTGFGLSATSANTCVGVSEFGYGIFANCAQNCYGSSYASDGVHVGLIAIGCYGQNLSGSGFLGLYSSGIAIGCFGSSHSGTGLGAFIAEGCHGASFSGEDLSVTHSVNSY
jgi:hypothetical protein